MGFHETVYDSVTFQDRVGALSLSDDQLCHHSHEKVSVVPWKKVVRRQVATAASVSTPMFKLILRSGTECIFKMEDRISLEVLRDDLGERLKTYRKLHPEEFVYDDNDKDAPSPRAVNKTRASFSDRRASTPYSMSVPQKEFLYAAAAAADDHLGDSSSMNFVDDDVSELSDTTSSRHSTTGVYHHHHHRDSTKYSPNLQPVKENRRASTGGPAFRRTYSGEAKVNKGKQNFRRSARS